MKIFGDMILNIIILLNVKLKQINYVLSFGSKTYISEEPIFSLYYDMILYFFPYNWK
jgi:hypothetical protein